MSYSYEDLTREMDLLKIEGYEVGTIGNSTMSRPTPYVFIGESKSPCVFVFGAIHAREYITAPLTLALIRYYNRKTGIYIVPMANPDGVELCQNNGADLGRTPYEFLFEANNRNTDFSLWKANDRAVDLNVNFNADWGTGIQNVNYPAPANYIGEYPDSEIETRNLIRFTNKINPALIISYHTKGELIYYGYKNYPDYYEYAKRFSDLTGYFLLKSDNSAGGYKDWFVKNYRRLGMTFEVGNEIFSYPFPLTEFPTIVEQNKGVYNLAGDVAEELWTKNLWISQFPWLNKR